MDIHKNARLSFRSREALARFVLEPGGYAEGWGRSLPRQRKDRRQVGWPLSGRRP